MDSDLIQRLREYSQHKIEGREAYVRVWSSLVQSFPPMADVEPTAKALLEEAPKVLPEAKAKEFVLNLSMSLESYPRLLKDIERVRARAPARK